MTMNHRVHMSPSPENLRTKEIGLRWESSPPMFKIRSGRGVRQFRVNRPKARGASLGDPFHEEVGRAYSLASRFDRSPARVPAEANDVPETTIHGWVKEARRRELMPQGRASKER
jgi:hypothetical protein